MLQKQKADKNYQEVKSYKKKQKPSLSKVNAEIVPSMLPGRVTSVLQDQIQLALSKNHGQCNIQ